jgi:hypothetical protein
VFLAIFSNAIKLLLCRIHPGIEEKPVEIRVEITEPTWNDVRPHYCTARGEFIGLRIGGDLFLREVFCPWCGTAVPERAPSGRDFPVRPEAYDGPRCQHGHPDVPCAELAQSDEKAAYELMCGAIREYRAAELARDLKCAERRVHELRTDLQQLHEAFSELGEQIARPPADYEPNGFVYLIGHDRAVKIGWTDRHPEKRRLSQLQVASSEPLEVLGLLLGTRSTEPNCTESSRSMRFAASGSTARRRFSRTLARTVSLNETRRWR